MGESRHEEASISEALDQIDVLAAEVKKSRAWVDSVIWTFCANSEEAYGQVCTANVDVFKELGYEIKMQIERPAELHNAVLFLKWRHVYKIIKEKPLHWGLSCFAY